MKYLNRYKATGLIFWNCTFHIACSFLLYHIDLYVYFLFSLVKMQALSLYVCYNWCKIGLQCIFVQSFREKLNHMWNSKCARNSTKFYHLFANVKIHWELMSGPHASETRLLNDYLVKIISLNDLSVVWYHFFSWKNTDIRVPYLGKEQLYIFYGWFTWMMYYVMFYQLNGE